MEIKTKINGIDHSAKMPSLDFSYDKEFYPDDNDLPDPQLCPILPGTCVPIQKVGIAPVDLPIKLLRRDGTEQALHAKVSLYGSLDDPMAKGLNLSRFYLLMHDKIANHISINALKDILKELQEKQNCKNAYCKLRFSYPWEQEALRTREELGPLKQGDSYSKEELFAEIQGKYLSHNKLKGHIFYNCELEGQLRDNEYKFYLTVDYVYSSTCPCSFELSQDARERRGKAANGHSQRSIAKIKVQFDPDKLIWIEDVIELARQQVPTEVQIVVKRRDEQAFAELNGANLIFTEDASRLLYAGLNEWFDKGKIFDFSIVTEHIESLHPWSAVAILYKGIKDGLQ